VYLHEVVLCYLVTLVFKIWGEPWSFICLLSIVSVTAPDSYDDAVLCSLIGLDPYLGLSIHVLSDVLCLLDAYLRPLGVRLGMAGSVGRFSSVPSVCLQGGTIWSMV
jgi:hypothetical protein